MTLCIGKYRREKISDKYLLLFLKNCGIILSAIPLGSAFGSEKMASKILDTKMRKKS